MQSTRGSALPWEPRRGEERAAICEVLVVCTANQARSPMMQCLLSAELHRRVDPRILVRSAGTRVLAPGSPVPGSVRAALVTNGVSPDAIPRSQPLTEAMIRNADLIITAETVHTHAVLDLSPSALPRTYRLLHLAEMAAAYLTSGIQVPFMDVLPIMRTSTHEVQPGDFELRDPIQPRNTDMAVVADRIHASSQLIAEALER